MGVFSNIQRALDTQLATLSGLPAVAWPNAKYVPVIGTTFIRPTVLPASSSLYTLNEVRHNPGIYQVDIFTEVEKGLNASLTLADSIKALFETDRRLTAGSDTIFIKQVSLGKGERQDAWNHIYVEINFECYSV
jgi:hypothetical protein